jgi:hypothetical protein
MSTQPFTYQKPNERNYLLGVVKTLELAGEADIAEMLRGARCAIRDTTTYSRKRWDAYWTSVDFAVPIAKLRTLDEDTKKKLIDVCSRVMPPEVGFDVMEVTMSPLLADEVREPTEAIVAEPVPPSPPSRKVFVVHGLDSTATDKLTKMLRSMELEPIVLREQPEMGRVLIEKLEDHARDVGYAFILLTPDDLGCQKGRTRNLRPRARQNVIFEFGYLMAELGRKNICCLYKGEVERPSDIEGIMYVPFKRSVFEAYEKILKELRGAGYNPTAKTPARLSAIRWQYGTLKISYKRIKEMASKNQTFSLTMPHEPADPSAVLASVGFPASIARKFQIPSLGLRRSTYAYTFEYGVPKVTISAKELYDELQYAGVRGNPSLTVYFKYPRS